MAGGSYEKLGILVGDEQALPLSDLPPVWDSSMRLKHADEAHELRALQERNDALWAAKVSGHWPAPTSAF